MENELERNKRQEDGDKTFPKSEDFSAGVSTTTNASPTKAVKKSVSKKAKKKVARKAKKHDVPSGAVLWEIVINKEDKELIESTIEEINEKSGKKLNLLTLLSNLINEESVNDAKQKVEENLKVFEELEKKQRELGIHILG